MINYTTVYILWTDKDPVITKEQVQEYLSNHFDFVLVKDEGNGCFYVQISKLDLSDTFSLLQDMSNFFKKFITVEFGVIKPLT